jgi:hypothetical protein
MKYPEKFGCQMTLKWIPDKYAQCYSVVQGEDPEYIIINHEKYQVRKIASMVQSSCTLEQIALICDETEEKFSYEHKEEMCLEEIAALPDVSYDLNEVEMVYNVEMAKRHAEKVVKDNLKPPHEFRYYDGCTCDVCVEKRNMLWNQCECDDENECYDETE